MNGEWPSDGRSGRSSRSVAPRSEVEGVHVQRLRPRSTGSHMQFGSAGMRSIYVTDRPFHVAPCTPGTVCPMSRERRRRVFVHSVQNLVDNSIPTRVRNVSGASARQYHRWCRRGKPRPRGERTPRSAAQSGRRGWLIPHAELSTFFCGQRCGQGRATVWTSLWTTLWTVSSCTSEG